MVTSVTGGKATKRERAIHTYIHTCMLTYKHTYIHLYIHTNVHLYIHTCIHTFFFCIHTNIYQYTYIPIYIYTCIYVHIRTYHLEDSLVLSSLDDWLFILIHPDRQRATRIEPVLFSTNLRSGRGRMESCTSYGWTLCISYICMLPISCMHGFMNGGALVHALCHPSLGLGGMLTQGVCHPCPGYHIR